MSLSVEKASRRGHGLFGLLKKGGGGDAYYAGAADLDLVCVLFLLLFGQIIAHNANKKLFFFSFLPFTGC